MYRAIVKNYCLGDGYKRIYHYHIRKTGGTSLNRMFLALSGKPAEVQHTRLHKARKKRLDGRRYPPNHRIVVAGKVFVGFNKPLFEQGHYFYGFSHIPAHQLKLPERTFTITCLRDPVSRILSHYNMLVYYRNDNMPNPALEEEGPWLGNSFGEFLSRIPRDHLHRQLYMFSSSYSVDEAFDNIVSCSHFFFTEDFSQGVKALSEKLGVSLQPVHARKAQHQATITPQDLERLRELLEPEIQLYERLRAFSRNS